METKHIVERVTELEKVQNEHGVAIALTKQQQDIIKKNLENINENIKWLVKLVAGGVVLGLLGLLFKF